MSKDLAVSKRVQKNSGMERTSLLLIVRKGGRERQEKKVKKKKERERERKQIWPQIAQQAYLMFEVKIPAN